MLPTKSVSEVTLEPFNQKQYNQPTTKQPTKRQPRNQPINRLTTNQPWESSFYTFHMMHLLLPHPLLTDHLKLLAAPTNSQNTLFAKQKYRNHFFVTPSNCLVHLQTAQIRYFAKLIFRSVATSTHFYCDLKKFSISVQNFSPVCCPDQLIVISCFV